MGGGHVGRAFRLVTAPAAAFVRRGKRRTRRVDTLSGAKGRSAAEDGDGRLFCFAMERRAIRGPLATCGVGDARRRKMAGQSHCPPGSAAAPLALFEKAGGAALRR